MTTYELAASLGDLLKKANKTATCAESCTGGGVAYAITQVSGSSAYFEQGFVTYSNQAKQQMLGVSEISLEQHGAVSEAVVREMVAGACQRANADIGVAISGVAGPGGGSEHKPVGTVWFGFQGSECVAEKVHFDGDREKVREQAIDYALKKLIDLVN